MGMFERLKKPKTPEQLAADQKSQLDTSMQIAGDPELYPGQFDRQQATEAIAQRLGKDWENKDEYQPVKERLDASVAKAAQWLIDHQDDGIA